MDAILELREVSKSFGGVTVIDDLSVSLCRGEALGVVGPNGAGKTTMLNLISGAEKIDSGEIFFEGRNLRELPRYDLPRHGIGRTYQVPRPFEGMTVFENVLVGAVHGRGEAERTSYECAVQALARAGMLDLANKVAGSLTLLDRKRLELGRALATEPRVLLLDEIAGGLTDAEVEVLIQTIGSLRDEGVSILWIEHIVHALLAVVDRLVAIDFGKKLCEGDPQEVICDPDVQKCYMGTVPV